MMARGTRGSNQRPDTLMQDRTSAHSTKSSCNARPDHTFGSKAEILDLSTRCPLYPGEFNESTQHLLILADEEVGGVCTDMVHAETEGRAVGALEERSMC